MNGRMNQKAQPNPKTTSWLWKVRRGFLAMSSSCHPTAGKWRPWEVLRGDPGGGTLRPRDGRREARLRLRTPPFRRTQAGASEDCLLTLLEPPNPFLVRYPSSHLPQSLTMMSGDLIQNFFRLDPGQLTPRSHDTYWYWEGGPLWKSIKSADSSTS